MNLYVISLSEISKQKKSNSNKHEEMLYFQLKLTALKQVAFTAKLVAANVKILRVSNPFYVSQQ